MALTKFQVESLATIDGGRIKAAFDAAMHRLIEDCHDRPDLKAARKLVLTTNVEPISAGGELDSVDVTFEMKDSVPSRESRTYNMDVARGGVVYNELSPDEVRQQTLDMEPKPKTTAAAPAGAGAGASSAAAAEGGKAHAV